MKFFTPLRVLVFMAVLAGAVVAQSFFPAVRIPADNPQTPEKIELGRRLFYDKRLSADSTISCSSCHIQAFAFSNAGNKVSTGIRGQKGTRNAPSLGNIGYRRSFFWEGGSPSLELQAMGPLTAHDEMGIGPSVLVTRLKAIPDYQNAFLSVFSDGVTMLNVTRAIASFERTIISNRSPYDRYRAGDEKALTPSALRGLELFFGEKGDCYHCHNGFNFTTETLHNTGLQKTNPDLGLARLTGKSEDAGKFKTPSLRNVALTAPYMHDGSVPTLEKALEHYNKGGEDNPNVDNLMRPLGLSKAEIADLIEFLKALTDIELTKDPRWAAPK
jgi:cytochrome c peroxidase